MQSMHLNIAGLQNFSFFLSSAAAGYLPFIFLGKCGVKLLYVKIFRFYKVFLKPVPRLLMLLWTKPDIYLPY